MAYEATRNENGQVKFVQNDPFFIDFSHLSHPARQFAEEAHNGKVQKRIYDAFLKENDLENQFELYKKAYIDNAYQKMIEEREERKRQIEEQNRLAREREKEEFRKRFYS